MRLEPERRRLMGERIRQATIVKNGGREHGIASRLAEMMDVSVQTASKWLRGSVTPGVDRWGEMAMKLDVNVQWLTGASHEMPSSIEGMVDEHAINLAGKAARLTFPLVMRLKPDIPQEELDEMVRRAYQQLQAGKSEDAVAGEVAQSLMS